MLRLEERKVIAKRDIFFKSFWDEVYIIDSVSLKSDEIQESVVYRFMC